jgi:hypothetical protein
MAEWPTHDEVVTLLRLPDDTADPDPVVEWARLAAIDYSIGRLDPVLVGWVADDGTVIEPDPNVAPIPDGVYEGTLIYAARFYRRRDSLDGTIGWGDMGVVRVGVKDNDAEALLARYIAVVVG